MEPTTQALFAAVLGMIVGGGAVLAWHISDRIQSRQPVPTPPAVPPGVATVLSVLRSSGVVVDPNDQVLKASAPAYALGLVHGTEIVQADLADLVGRVRRDGQIRETELVIEGAEGHAPRTVTARVAPLGARLVLALVEDRTRERRVESIRRDFVANVSHELKTPVGAIQLLAEAVRDASDDPEAVQRFAGRMHLESERLARLVQQIIELSRLQDDRMLDHPEIVDLDRLLHDAVDPVTTDAQSRGISVIIRGEQGVKVLGNAGQLALAVSNLVANAVTYSRDRSSVLVSAILRGDQVEISVTDQGIGIPAAEIERIFERFYRVDPARHRSTGGTGLGLSIVKHVAATHGGDVRVWSVEGQGSTFTLTLPRGEQEGTA